MAVVPVDVAVVAFVLLVVAVVALVDRRARLARLILLHLSLRHASIMHNLLLARSSHGRATPVHHSLLLLLGCLLGGPPMSTIRGHTWLLGLLLLLLEHASVVVAEVSVVAGLLLGVPRVKISCTLSGLVVHLILSFNLR